MAVVLLSGDLMGASRIDGAARLAGVGYRMVGTVDAAIEACRAVSATLILVDLATPGIDVVTLVERAQASSERPPTIVAYGPHVHEAILAAAESAGCDQVMSRGQFMSRVDAIIAEHAHPAG
jgi:CheY-like chemotaxis protein